MPHLSALRSMQFACILSAVSLVLSFAPPATAQSASDRTTARSLAQEAQEAFDLGDFATAEDRFARAEALVHAPTLLLALARSQVKLGKLVQGYENYQRVLREGLPENAPDVWKEAQAHAKGESDAVRPRLGWVTIVVRGASDPRVVLEDGTIVPKPALGVKRAVNPGEHEITAAATGFRTEKTAFQIGEGQAIAVTLSLEVDPTTASAGPSGLSGPSWQAAGIQDAPPPSGSSQKTWGYVGLGVGAVGIIAGSVTGVLAMGQHGELASQCPGGQCPKSEQAALDSYRSMGNISTVTFAVGAVGAVVGLTLVLTAPATPVEVGTGLASLQLEAGFRRLSLAGRF